MIFFQKELHIFFNYSAVSYLNKNKQTNAFVKTWHNILEKNRFFAILNKVNKCIFMNNLDTIQSVISETLQTFVQALEQKNYIVFHINNEDKHCLTDNASDLMRQEQSFDVLTHYFMSDDGMSLENKRKIILEHFTHMDKRYLKHIEIPTTLYQIDQNNLAQLDELIKNNQDHYDYGYDDLSYLDMDMDSDIREEDIKRLQKNLYNFDQFNVFLLILKKIVHNCTQQCVLLNQRTSKFLTNTAHTVLVEKQQSEANKTPEGAIVIPTALSLNETPVSSLQERLQSKRVSPELRDQPSKKNTP